MDPSDFSWEEAFEYAIEADAKGGVKFGPVMGEEKNETLSEKEMLDYKRFEKVFFFQQGENDGPPWIFLVKHLNGYYVYFSAWCDYTGFECQGGKTIEYSRSWQRMWNLGLTDEVREMVASQEWFQVYEHACNIALTLCVIKRRRPDLKHLIPRDIWKVIAQLCYNGY